MKSAKKILTWVGVTILVILLVLIIGFNLFGASMIKTVVEVAASSNLGVPVTVKSISLALLRGKVEIQGLVVSNPPGYANPTIFELGDGVVNLDIGSLMSDTIKIQLIKLDNTKLTIEQKGLTNNLKEILDKLPKEEQKEPAPTTEKKAEPTAEKSGKNLTITRLEITGTNVQVKLLPIAGKSDTLSIKLDPIIMENLGTDSKLKIGSVIGKVLGALGTGVAKQMGGATTELGKDAVKSTTEAGKGVVEGIKGIFGGKKTDPNK